MARALGRYAANTMPCSSSGFTSDVDLLAHGLGSWWHHGGSCGVSRCFGVVLLHLPFNLMLVPAGITSSRAVVGNSAFGPAADSSEA